MTSTRATTTRSHQSESSARWRRELVFTDGATQVFEADGGTTYVDNGRPTRGEWYIDDDGHFGSFWPPSYRAHYDLRWMVEDRAIVGLRFTELVRGSQFDGRYRV